MSEPLMFAGFASLLRELPGRSGTYPLNAAIELGGKQTDFR